MLVCIIHAGHTSIASRASTTENAKRLDSSSGNMTNNQFSSLHTHSEIVTVLEGYTVKTKR